jgi:hypothetical protein
MSGPALGGDGCPRHGGRTPAPAGDGGAAGRGRDLDVRVAEADTAVIGGRRIPAHERALAGLEGTLEELQREDAARVRRLTYTEGGGAAAGH